MNDMKEEWAYFKAIGCHKVRVEQEVDAMKPLLTVVAVLCGLIFVVGLIQCSVYITIFMLIVLGIVGFANTSNMKRIAAVRREYEEANVSAKGTATRLRARDDNKEVPASCPKEPAHTNEWYVKRTAELEGDISWYEESINKLTRR